MTFLFVCEIYREPLSGFAPNSQGRRVWYLAQTSLNVKVKDQRSKVKVTSDSDKNGVSADISGIVALVYNLYSV